MPSVYAMLNPASRYYVKPRRFLAKLYALEVYKNPKSPSIAIRIGLSIVILVS